MKRIAIKQKERRLEETVERQRVERGTWWENVSLFSPTRDRFHPDKLMARTCVFQLHLPPWTKPRASLHSEIEGGNEKRNRVTFADHRFRNGVNVTVAA